MSVRIRRSGVLVAVAMVLALVALPSSAAAPTSATVRDQAGDVRKGMAYRSAPTAYRRAADVRRVGVRADLDAGTVTLTGRVAEMPDRKPRRMTHYFWWTALVGTGESGFEDDAEFGVSFSRGDRLAVVRQVQDEVCEVPVEVDAARAEARVVVPESCLPPGTELSHLYFYVNVNQGRRTVGNDVLRAGRTPVVQIR